MNIFNMFYVFLFILATAKPVAKFNSLSRFAIRVDPFFHYNYDSVELQKF
jgi:hypothetical protein